MRRCHNYTGPLKTDWSDVPASPVPSERKQSTRSVGRKRSAASAREGPRRGEKRSRTSIDETQNLGTSDRAIFVPNETFEEIRTQQLSHEWHQRHLRLGQCYHELSSPADLQILRQLRDNIDAMNRIAEQLNTC